MQLGHDLVRQHERVDVGLAHGPRHAVHQHRQFGPVVDEGQVLVRTRVIGLVQHVVSERLEFQPRLVEHQAVTRGRVHHVAHVHVVGPALRPVFPGMGRGIGADVAELPVRRRPVFVVPLQAVAVVERLVAEQRTTGFEPVAVGNQAVPVVMSDLVPQMADQGAIRLVHVGARAFAMHIVGLDDVERDQAVVVAGHHRRAAVGCAQEVEHQAVFGVLRFARSHRQAQHQQRRHQASLGHLDARPQHPVVRMLRIVQVRDRAIEPTGAAQSGLRTDLVDRHQPVAG